MILSQWSLIMQGKYIWLTIFATDFLVETNNFIKHNSNNWRKMMKKRKRQLILSLLSKKLILKMIKCYWFLIMDGQGEDDEDIAMFKLIKRLQKQVSKDNFQKKETGG